MQLWNHSQNEVMFKPWYELALSHWLKLVMCLCIKMASDTCSRPSNGIKRKDGEVLRGMQEGVWSSGLRAVGQPPEGEAHGANSCRGETLTPLNVQSSKQRWAEHMPQGEERVNGATQLTPWRKEIWPLWNGLLKSGAHHSGGPARDPVRET